MLGSLLAGTSESPGETEIFKAVALKFIVVWVLSAQWKKGSKDRYFQEDAKIST